MNSNSLRKEFDYVESRKVCYEINCCNDFEHCVNYLALKNQDERCIKKESY